MNATPTCSFCGEPRPDDRPHDAQRCSTIAHAYAMIDTGEPSEADKHIVELSQWRRDHPLTRFNAQQREDRRIALDRWIELAQLIASRGGAR